MDEKKIREKIGDCLDCPTSAYDLSNVKGSSLCPFFLSKVNLKYHDMGDHLASENSDFVSPLIVENRNENRETAPTYINIDRAPIMYI